MAELKVAEDEYDSYTNEDLLFIVSCKEEDEEEALKAFKIFYDKNVKWFFTLCVQVCSTITIYNETEDLAKAVFNGTMHFVWDNAGKYDKTKSKVQTWVSNNARYIMYDILNEYKGKVSGGIQFVPITKEVDIASADESDNYSDVETPEILALAVALQSLSDRERDILMEYMRYSDGNKHLPNDVLIELCQRYMITSDNARQIKKRALEKVRKHIDKGLKKI